MDNISRAKNIVERLWGSRIGLNIEERDWLEEKYPGWNDTFGKCWDVIADKTLSVYEKIAGTER